MTATTHISCGSCGIPFCLPTSFYEARVRDSEVFTCPNGHHISYKPSAAQKQISELEAMLAAAYKSRRSLASDYDDILAQREDLLAALKECPGRCGWKSRRQVPRDPVSMGRGLERVRMDVALHLVEVHGARPMVMAELAERT